MNIAVLAGGLGTCVSAYNQYKTGGGGGRGFVLALTGHDINYDVKPDLIAKNLLKTYGPLGAGFGISKVASYTGVNRKLPKGINV